MTLLILLLSWNGAALADDSTANSKGAVDTVIIYPKPHHVPFDSVVAGFEKLTKVGGELVGTVQDGMKKEGVIGYIRKHKDVFVPVFAVILLYGVWLRKRAIK